MAHNLNIEGGNAAMAYYGQTPRHGLGTPLTRVATSKEMLEAAGLDWEVEKRPIYLGDGTAIEKHRAVVRLDTGKVLGIVGDGFRPVQNRESFALLDALVGEAAAMFHTAGALGNGEKVWALVKLPGHLVVAPDDVMEKYLLMANGHNGTLALTVKPTTIRVVCQNTMDLALGSNKFGRQVREDGAVYVRHSESAEVRLDEIRRVLGISLRTFEVAGEHFRAMSAKQINDEILKGYLNAVIPVQVEKGAAPERVEAAKARQKEIHETIAFLFQEGRGNQGSVRGTLWAALNGVTEWLDHVNVLRQDGTLKAHGLETAIFGVGAQIRQRAYREAVALLG